ncbi:MAG: DUF1801 domain-containing protein [Candidatus Cryosericum sp.]
MNASELIDDLIANLTDWRGATLASIRRIIREADPDVVEEWKWMGSPAWSHDGLVCIANAFKDKVKLTFPQGASLADPDKLFNNGLAGKQWRSVDIYKDDTISERSLKVLVRDAVDYNHSTRQSTKRPQATRGNPKKRPENKIP